MSRQDDRFEHGPDEADPALILRYLDGALSEDEARAFELRLGTEPELAHDFDELADTDRELHLALAADEPSSRGRPRSSWVVPIAVASGIALILGTFWWARRAGDARDGESRIALVETAPSDAGFNELLGIDGEWLPLGMGYRAEGAATPPQADEYASALLQALQVRVDAALESAEPRTAAESFVLAFNPGRDCHVVLVVDRGERGRERVLPRRAPGVLRRAGETYLLPEEPLHLPDDWRESQRVDYRPGILTRDGIDVTLAVRSEAIPPALLRELDDLLASAQAMEELPRLRSWFAEHGFEVRELRVDPPGDD